MENNDYIVLKIRQEDGTIKIENYGRLTELTKRMKKIVAYGTYFQVIHDPVIKPKHELNI